MTCHIVRNNTVVYLLKPGRLQMLCTVCHIHVRDIALICQLCGGCELICWEDIFHFSFFIGFLSAFTSLSPDVSRVYAVHVFRLISLRTNIGHYTFSF